MNICLPEKVENIIDTLTAAGYEAYAVGGCVRDMLLNKRPDDWDITTSAKPGQVKSLFGRTFDTGIRHGTVSVLMGGDIFEVTTYRVDGDYGDHRHPESVTFTGNLREDLLRRDFTVNAMAYNEKDGLIDIFGGARDLKRKIIRCVGDPRQRFKEDALRILRALRFSAQLGFETEKATRGAIKELAPSLLNISAERIQAELVKIATSSRPGILRDAYELGVTAVILPEFDAMMETTQETPHHMYTVGEHTLKVMEAVRADKVLRLAALLHDVAKPRLKTIDKDGVAHFKMHDEVGSQTARDILRRLKFDNATVSDVTRLVRAHDYRPAPTMKGTRRAINKIGADLFPLYLELREADVLAQSDYKREEKLSDIKKTRRCYDEISQKGECVTLKQLKVTGSDLIDIGIKPGKQIGDILRDLLDAVLDNPALNEKEILLKIAKNFSGQIF